MGIGEARGERIVTMDSDLQIESLDIPKLLGYIDKFDMAIGWRMKHNDPFLKRISSKIDNLIRNRLSGDDIRDSAYILRAFKKDCIKDIKVFNGIHRFFSTLVKMKSIELLRFLFHIIQKDMKNRSIILETGRQESSLTFFSS